MHQNYFKTNKKIEQNHVPGLNAEVISSWRLKVTAGITLLSLQTGDNSVEPTKAKSNTSKVCLLYREGNLVKNVRRKIVVVLKILRMWERHADTASHRNPSYGVVCDFTTPPKRDAGGGQGGIEELHTIKTSQHYWAVGLLLHGVSINNFFFLTIWIVIRTLINSLLNNSYQDE